jgi:hypothetical protein
VPERPGHPESMSRPLRLALLAVALTGFGPSPRAAILDPASFKPLVNRFNAQDQELHGSGIPNAEAWDFLAANVPLFECPDEELQKTYWFRWWVYRKHLRKTPDGWVVTEFKPDVPWAGRHNTINMAAELHLLEGRWLADPRYLDDYSRFWFGAGKLGSLVYTNWLADGIWKRAAVTGDFSLAVELLDELIAQQHRWDEGKAGRGVNTVGRRPNGLYFTLDAFDGSEMSIGGHGFRPLTNAAAYGNMRAISEIAAAAGREEVAEEFRGRAARLKELVQAKLWDHERRFFTVLREDESARSDVRELWGLAPWMFHLPDPGFETGWRELDDPAGFKAPFGPTFPEQRHPRFTLSYKGHECQWNGPSWPLATSITLTALANLLNDYRQAAVGKDLFYETLQTYSRSQRRRREDGLIVPWIDENLHPYTGDWMARTMLANRRENLRLDPGTKPISERGKDYNHSTFCDLVISGLVGIRPRHDDRLIVNPLLPAGTWDWFCLDRVPYHGRILTVIWDRDGTRYNRGAGFQLLVDGQPAARSEGLTRLEARLAPSRPAPLDTRGERSPDRETVAP